MHIHAIENGEGNVVDVIPFCCDSCHRDYCEAHADLQYAGWNGCNEGGDSTEYCAQCGVVCHAGNDACEHQRDNIVVNRFLSDEGERCEHGHWVQLPARLVSP